MTQALRAQAYHLSNRLLCPIFRQPTRARAARRALAERRWRQVGDRADREDLGRPRRLAEVELLADVAEDARRLAHVGTGIRPAVGGRIEPLPAEKDVLDELQVRVVAEDLMVDVARLRVWADHDPRHPQAVAVLVDDRRHHVIVEPTPVIPGEEDRSAAPVWAPHDRVDQARHVRLAGADQRSRMLRHVAARVDPRHRRERPGLRRGEEVGERLDVAQLVVLQDIGEVRQGVPDPWRLEVLGNGLACHRLVDHTVGLGAFQDVVRPADVVLVQQVSDVGPGKEGGLVERRTDGVRAV